MMIRRQVYWLVLILLHVGALGYGQNTGCGLTVDAGPDLVACAPVGQVALQGQISGPYLSFQWEPATGLSDPTVLQPTATVSVPTSYVLTATAVDPTVNLITNGDFEQGNVGFSSSYTYSPSNLAFNGTYTVTSSPSLVYSNFPPCVDHTTGMGQMLIVNGDDAPGTQVWCQTVNVVPNTDYVFTAWVSNITPIFGLPALQLAVNGVAIGSVFTPPATPCDWNEWTVSWNSGSTTTVEMCILSQSVVSLGNDFAIDDISLSPICEVSDEVQLSLIQLQATADPVVFISCSALGNEGIMLDATASSSGPNITYLWTTTDGQILSGAHTLQPVVNQTGTYMLQVNYNDGITNCTAQAAVTVLLDPDQPFAIIAPPDTITCIQPAVILDASNSTSGPNYEISWQVLSGNIVSGGQSLTPMVDQPGLYQLTLTNLQNGCSTTSTVNVVADTSAPQAIIAPADTLRCDQTSIWLDASASAGTGIQLSWQVLSGNLLSSPDSAVVAVDAAGTYSLIATNVHNGCSDTAATTVVQAADVPQAYVWPPDTITCATPHVLVQGQVDSMGDGMWMGWLDSTGTLIALQQADILIDAPGIYAFVVMDTLRDCGDTAWIQVAASLAVPTLSWLAPKTITCTDTAQWLVATVADTLSVQWQTPEGQTYFGDSLWTPLSGFFQLTAINPHNGCADTAMLWVPIDTLSPFVEVGPTDTITCAMPTVALHMTTTADSIWWQLPNSVAIPDSQSIVVDTAGLYVVHGVRTANGCRYTDTVWVVDGRYWPTVIVDPPEPLNCQNTSTWLTASDSDHGPDFKWIWTSIADGDTLAIDSDSASISTMQMGAYALHIIHLPSGCRQSDTTILSVDTAAPVIQLTLSDTITCVQPTVSLYAQASNSSLEWQWTTPDGLLLDGDPGPVAQVGAAGTYVVIATDTINGCADTAQVVVPAWLDQPMVVLAAADALDCATTSVPIMAQGIWSQTVDFTWWTPHDTFPLLGLDSIFVAGNPGWYVVQVRDTRSQCVAIDSLYLPADTTKPAFSLSNWGILTCQTPAVPLSFQGAATLTAYWTAPNGQILNVLPADTLWVDQVGQWSLSIVGANHCSVDTLVHVLVDTLAPKLMLVDADTLTCAQPSVALVPTDTAQAHVQYRWAHTSGIDTLAFVLDVAQAGWWRIMAEDTINGCVATDSLWLHDARMPPQVQLLLWDTLAPPCVVDSVLLQVVPLQDYLTFQWSATQGSIVGDTLQPKIWVTAAGNYSLTVRDTLSGCSWDTLFNVPAHTAEAMVQLLGESLLTCDYPQKWLYALHDAGSTLNWHTLGGHFLSENGDSALIDAAGIYWAEVMDTFGCSAADTLVVIADMEPPSLTLPQAPTLNCIRPNWWAVPLQVQAQEPIIDWMTADGVILHATSDSAWIGAAGTYVAQLTDQHNGCTVEDTLVVVVDTVLPWVDVGPDTVLTCATPQVALSVSATAANGRPLIMWHDPLGQVLPPDALWATMPGPYVVVATDTANGCSYADTLFVDVDTVAPDFSLLPFGKITCMADSVVLSIATSAPPQWTVQWRSPSAELHFGPTTTATQAGTWTVTATDLTNGCQHTDTLDVAIDTVQPQLFVEPIQILDCLTGQVVTEAFVDADHDVVVQWSTPDGAISSASNQLQLSVTQPGQYICSVVDVVNGCSATDTVQVVTQAPLAVSFQLTHPNCIDTLGALLVDSVIGGTPPFAFSVDGSPLMQRIWFTDLKPGQHQLTVVDAAGCSLDTSFVLQPIDRPNLLLIGPIRVFLGDTMLFTPIIEPQGISLSQVEWWPAQYLSCSDCLQPTFFAEEEGSFFYRLTVQTTQYCVAEADLLIKVVFDAPIFVANVFSPNGDGYNDRLVPMANSERVLRIDDFAIYDRWGTLIYRAHDFLPGDESSGWDGQFRAQPAPSGLYVWILQAQLANGEQQVQYGDVLLLR